MKKKIPQRIEALVGPYRGYLGRAEYDGDAELFHGQVIGTRDVITFQSKTPKGVEKAFVGSVDDYLAFCEERGESPEKPYSGKFVARLTPELHRKLTTIAESSGVSLNQLVADCLGRAAEEFSLG